MSTNSFSAKFLRFLGIVLMAITGGFTLLGGIGTTCAALFPNKYESMASLAPFQWLYILFVLTDIAIGAWGLWATVKLVRGTSDAYKMSLYVLLAGVVIGGRHIYMSRLLRGKSMPVDAVVYTTILTLVIFLLFRLPLLWQGANFEKSDSSTNRTAGGTASILLGMLTLTIQYTMGSTHTWEGINYANAFFDLMTVTGCALLLVGLKLLVRVEAWRPLLRLHFQKRSV